MGPFLVAGVVFGSIYAISSTGLVFTYMSTGIFNLAFAAQAYFIARFYYFLNTQHNLPPWWAGVLAIVCAGPALGVLLWAVVFRHLKHSSTLIKIVATIGLSVSLPAISSLIFGNINIVAAPGLAPEPVMTFDLFNVIITLDQIIVIAAIVVLGIVGAYIFRATDIGLAVRGLVDSEAMTKISGTNSSLIGVSVWAIGSFLSGLAGVLIAPLIGLSLSTFTVLLSAAFAAVIIARLKSLTMAIAASMLLGVVTEVLQYILPTTSSLTTELIYAVPFVFMAVFILGEAIVSRGTAREVRAGGPLDDAIHINVRGASVKPARTSTHSQITSERNGASATRKWQKSGRRVSPSFVAFALLFAVPFVLNGYWVGLFACGVAFGIAFLAITLTTGEGGMIWLCQITFAGVGAVTYAALAEQHVPIFLGLIVSALTAALLGVLVGFLTVWLGDLRTTLLTLSVGLIADQLFFMWGPVYNDGSGIAVARPSFLSGDLQFSLLALAVFGLFALMIGALRRSTTGLALSAIRSSERGSRSLGLGVISLKVMVGALGAAAAGAGGALLALYSLSALPPSYATLGGLIWLAIVVTLGARSTSAALVAGLMFAIIPGVFLQYLSPSLSQVPTAMFGLGAVLVAANPDGLVAMHGRQLRGALARWNQFRNKDDAAQHFKIPAPTAFDSDRRIALAERVPPTVDSSELVQSTGAREAIASVKAEGDLESTAEIVVLRAEELSVRFGGVQALTDVSVEVPKGKIIGLVGPNGAGKSTLFGVLSGFQTTESGRVWLGGQDVSRWSPRERARRGLARTFQHPELFWTMTVKEHVVLGYRAGHDPSKIWRDWLAVKKVRSLDEETQVTSILNLLGLMDVADRNVTELPLGLGRLVEVARAIATSPTVLLLDEPCAGLDSQETHELGRVLQHLVRQGGTGILLVEHDLELVMRISDEIIVLDHGAVIARGSAAQMREDLAVRRAYLGSELSLMGYGE
ncbi:MAG: branched-chain amino acid ABC transporter permease/ATP-binding protein [Acidimicrobiales bacterium]